MCQKETYKFLQNQNWSYHSGHAMITILFTEICWQLYFRNFRLHKSQKNICLMFIFWCKSWNVPGLPRCHPCHLFYFRRQFSTASDGFPFTITTFLPPTQFFPFLLPTFISTLPPPMLISPSRMAAGYDSNKNLNRSATIASIFSLPRARKSEERVAEI